MLQGSFETFDFAELLGMLSRKRQTGKLRLHCGTSSVELYMADGRLTYAESTDHGTSARAADTGDRLEEACFEVLRWEHGSFEFHPGQKATSRRRTDATVDSVLAGARQRLTDWERVQELIPSLDAQPRLVPELTSETVVVTRQAWRVLAAVDGRRNGHALSRILGLSPYELSGLLADLVSSGLLQMSPRPKVTVAALSAGRNGEGLTSVRLPGNTAGRPGPQLDLTDRPREGDAAAGPSTPEEEKPEAVASDRAQRTSAFRLSRRVRPANG